MSEEENIKMVEDVFFEKLKVPVILSYLMTEEKQPEEKAELEPKIKNALETFQGRIVSRWHNE